MIFVKDHLDSDQKKPEREEMLMIMKRDFKRGKLIQNILNRLN